MGQYYHIFTKYEDAVYERGETNYYVVKVKNTDANTYVDPSSISISVTNSCGTSLVSSASMTKDSTGIYHYEISIPSSAIYGEYEIEVVATSASGVVSKFKDKFFVLPWNVTYDVRKLSGITSKKSVSDHDIALIIWEAYKEALDDVFEFHADQTPKCNPDTGEWIDGSNTTFETPHGRLADHDGDGSVLGYGESSCATDIDGWWRDEDGNEHRCKITVNNTHSGNITITQLDGTAIPSSAEWVHLNYWTEWRTYDERIFKYAVCYLAAHKCIVRFQELDRATILDLGANKKYYTKRDMKRMWNEYLRAINKIRKPLVGGGMIPGGE